ncbi:MAG: outer membrane lipoprotein carrier protein LolA [Ichthyobacteriaceae bacterium]|nr:outer membrane lipoprotein carrier protein LolA [Ichthyobacteriaceae bacterium]
MKKIGFIVLVIAFVTNGVFAQNKQKAQELLDKVSENTSSYIDMEIDFTYSMDNNAEDVHQNRSGSVFVKKEKFRIEMDIANIIFDGSKRFTIVEDEVTISDAEDESGISSPTQILDMYKEGYSLKWDILQKVQGKNIQYVRLIPIDSESEYKYILVGCDTKKNDLYNVIYTDKQGTQYKLQIDKMVSNQDLPETLFGFDKSKYPETEYLYNDLTE